MRPGRGRAGRSCFPAAGAVATAVSATAALIIWIVLQPHQLFAPLSWLMPATFAAMGSLIGRTGSDPGSAGGNEEG